MYALFIDVDTKSISRIKLPDDETKLFDAIKRCIGCNVLGLGAVLANRDVLHVNQLGALQSEQYFKHRSVNVPVPDSAVLLGSDAETGAPRAVRSGLSTTSACIRFLSRWDALEWAIVAQRGCKSERAA